MSVSVFEKLLGSYSGMRKRTWTPSVISEASVTWWAQQFSLGDEVDSQTKAAQYQQAKTNLEKAAAEQGTMTPAQAIQQLTTYGQAAATNQGVQVVNRQGQKPMAIKKEKVPEAVQGLELLIQKAQTEKSKKQDSDKGDKDSEKSKDEPGAAEPQEMQGFSRTQRDEIAEYVEQKLDLDPSQAQTFVQKIQNTILTPLSKTKLGKLFDARPDASSKIKEQLLDLTSRFFSMASKVESVTLADGTQVKVIRSERLSSGDRKAAQVITVRGVNGEKGVNFGRADGEYIEDYKELQEFSRAYDHKTYGASLGSAMNRFGKVMFDTRILPEGVDPSAMTKEDFEKLDLAAQK